MFLFRCWNQSSFEVSLSLFSPKFLQRFSRSEIIVRISIASQGWTKTGWMTGECKYQLNIQNRILINPIWIHPTINPIWLDFHPRNSFTFLKGEWRFVKNDLAEFVHFWPFLIVICDSHKLSATVKNECLQSQLKKNT